MELVYLWVEDYKNIKKQGFNFSPRFQCEFKDEYGEDGKLKDNCELVICDKDKNECEDNDYIENFFGDNINMTAIVGKNGSGKSGICLRLQQINDYIKNDDDGIFIIGFKIQNNIKVLTNKSNIKSSVEIDFIDRETYEVYQSDYEQFIYLLEQNLSFFILRAEESNQLTENISNLAIKNSNFENNFAFELTTFMRYPKIIQLFDDEEYKNDLIDDIQPPAAVYSNNPENGAPFPPCYHELLDLNPNNSLEAYMINIIVKDDVCDEFFKKYQSYNDENIIQEFYDSLSDKYDYNLIEYENLISSVNYVLDDISNTNRLLIKKYNANSNH